MNPILWYGGKSGLAARIAKSVPDHTTYAEPFGGGAAVLLAKPRADTEYVSDINPVSVDLLRTVRDHPACIVAAVASGVTKERWFDAQAQCYLAAPHGNLSTKAQHAEAEAALAAGTHPLVGAALGVEAWIATACGYNGRLTGNRIGDTWFSKKMAAQAARRAEGLAAASARLRDVYILERDGMQVIADHADDPNALLFVDPPYMYAEDGGGSRTKRSTYGVGEADRDWHHNLIDALLAARCKVVLTTGNDALYIERMADWPSELVHGAPAGGSGTTRTRTRRVRHIIWSNATAKLL